MSTLFSWFKKNKVKRTSHGNGQQEIIADQATTAKPESEPDTVQQSEWDEPAAAPRQYWNSGASVEHWVGEMYNEELKKGAFDHLPGKGKPLEVPTGDVTNSILKNANVLPDWLMLQHEIRDQLQVLLSASNSDDKQTQRELDMINKKIKKYNTLVPSNVLQKRKLTKEDMHKQFQQWA